jgi:hypothetical protein
MKDAVTFLDLVLLVSIKQSPRLPQGHLKCFGILADRMAPLTLVELEGSKLRLWRLQRHLRSRCYDPGRTHWLRILLEEGEGKE